MGCPMSCYKEILQRYVLTNVRVTKLEKKYTQEYLSSLSLSDLEVLVLCFNKEHQKYAAFVMGIAVNDFLETYKECNDILNASASAITSVYELLDIDEPEDDVDFV